MRWLTFERARMIILLAGTATMGCLKATRTAAAGTGAPSASQSDANGAHHYFDDSGAPLPQRDFIWTQLAA